MSRKPRGHSGLDEASMQAMPGKAANPSAKLAAKPHFLGHRQRLRERFAQSPDILPDYELLELILFRSIPRADVKGIAKALIARFGTFAEVLGASPDNLAEVDGVGGAIIHDLKLIEAAA